MQRFIIALAMLTAFVVSGCQQFQKVSLIIDATVQRNLPATCSLIASSHTAFMAIHTATPLRPSVVRLERAGIDAAATVCDDPAQVTTANALIIATDAYAAVAKALREAEKVEDAGAAL